MYYNSNVAENDCTIGNSVVFMTALYQIIVCLVVYVTEFNHIDFLLTIQYNKNNSVMDKEDVNCIRKKFRKQLSIDCQGIIVI